QVIVTEALPCLGGGACRRGGRLEVAAGLVLEHLGEQQVSPLDAVTLLALQQALRPRKPAGGPADLAGARETHADPECAANRTQGIAGVEIAVVSALDDARPLTLAAEHRRGCRQELEVSRGQRRGAVSLRQGGVGVPPRTCGVRAAAGFEERGGVRRRGRLLRPSGFRIAGRARGWHGWTVAAVLST